MDERVLTLTAPDGSAEVERLHKIIEALMDRAERPGGAQGSEFGQFQSTIMLEEQVRRRTAELAAALHANERTHQALVASEARFSAMINQAQEGVIVIDNGKFSYSNANFNEMLGYGGDELRQVGPEALAVESDRAGILESMQKVISGAEPRFDRVVRMVCKAGAVIDVDIHGGLMEFGGKKSLVCLVMDVTRRVRAEQEVQALQERLRDQLTRDALTGLYNRRYLEESLTRELLLAQRHGHPVSLIFGDLDHFKGVNDRYGHLAGDEVLRAFGMLMKSSARASDIYCRYGGEEFLLVLPQMAQPGALTRAEDLRHAMATTPVAFGDFLISVTASFGVATFPQDGRSSNTLIAAADSAMYTAKMAGRNRVAVAAAAAAAVAAQPPAPTGITASTAAARGGQSQTGLPELSAAERRFLAMTENVTDLVVVADAHGRITYVSPSVQAVTGYAPQEVVGHALPEFVAVTARQELAQSFARLLVEPGAINRAERWYLHKDGHLVMGESVTHNLLDDPAVAGIVINLRDITQRHQAEHDLLLFRTLLDHANDSILVVDAQTLQILDVNKRTCSDLGHSREELLAMTVLDIDPNMRVHDPAVEKALGETGTALFEGVQRRKDGSTYAAEVSLKRIMLDRPYILSMVRNITERKRMKQALQDSDVRFRTLIDAASDIIAIAGADGTIKYINEAVRRVAGYDPKELIGRSYLDVVPPPERVEAGTTMAETMRRPGETVLGERPLLHKNGSVLEVEASFRNLIGIPGIDGVIISLRDVSRRKAAEAGLRDNELMLRTITSAVVHAQSEPLLLQEMCRALVDVGRFRMAWVGLAQADAARTILAAAWAGEASDNVHTVDNTWGASGRGLGPAGRCIRTGQAQVSREIATDPTMLAWHDEAVQHGYRSAVALPLRGHAGVVGALMIFAGKPDAFDAEELKLLLEMAGDLSYGIVALHTRAANEDSLRQLERSMDSTVRALGSMAELRDPYTAGHQRRVASIAVEIGKLLGLDDHRLRGLNVGATMHDIGKIVVPAEILSKPGVLLAGDVALLQEHAAAGAEILAGVEFPWPVAEMIRQHHERLDGGGYPRGLKGDQILLEARIIAVADLVEAVSSDRPYRPGLGIAAALAELTRQRGLTYDAQVVDACLKLFGENKYRIPA